MSDKVIDPLEEWHLASVLKRQVYRIYGSDTIMADRARKVEDYWREYCIDKPPPGDKWSSDKAKERLEAAEARVRDHRGIDP